MSLAKLTIKHEVSKRDDFTQGLIEALFNPTQLAYSRSVTWNATHVAGGNKEAQFQKVDFGSAGLETLTIDLFFDTYEGDPKASTTVVPGEPTGGKDLSRRNAVSVLKYTNAIASLTQFQPDLHQPPVCELYWGTRFLFKGVLQSLSQEFTFFLEDGTPVRATSNCVFQQYQTQEDRIQNQLYSADVVKRHLVLPGDTLSSIAAAVYQDPAQWRRIAAANKIENPRRLQPGQVLAIPKIR